MNDALLSVEQAASWLGVGKRTLTRLLSAGEVAFVKVGKRTLVEPRALRAYVAMHRSSTEEPGSPGPATGKQLAALHVRCDELDAGDREQKGFWKELMLRRASENFGRQVVSARDLNYDELGWVLDQLADELAKR